MFGQETISDVDAEWLKASVTTVLQLEGAKFFTHYLIVHKTLVGFGKGQKIREANCLFSYHPKAERRDDISAPSFVLSRI